MFAHLLYSFLSQVHIRHVCRNSSDKNDVAVEKEGDVVDKNSRNVLTSLDCRLVGHANEMQSTVGIECLHFDEVASLLNAEGKRSARETFVGRARGRQFVEWDIRKGIVDGILFSQLATLLVDGLVRTVEIVRQPSEFQAWGSYNQQ